MQSRKPMWQKASIVLLMKWKLIRRMGLSRWMLVIC